jgi:flagellar biosynthesis/type III secretory pathway chaperone
MRAYVEELKEILSNEGKLYQTLLELGKKKQEIITKGMVKELDQITQVEQSLVLQIGKEEHRREKVVEMIRKEVSLRDDITVSELIFHLDEEDQIVLEEERQKLMKILSSIKETNDLNKVLIQYSL